MSEMIERVAIALAAASDFNWEFMPESHPDEWSRADMRGRARAVIEAMREPTGAMRDAAATIEESVSGCDDDYNRPIGHGLPVEVWQTMIDEALK